MAAGRWRIGALCCLCCVAAAPTLHAQVDPIEPRIVHTPYAHVGTKPLTVDLYLPQPGRGGPYPLVIWIHGGAWRMGDKRPLTNHVDGALKAGFAVAAVNYRLTSQAGEYGDQPVVWPAQIHDVKGAIRFLRANAAAFNVDPGRFAVWGTSAGAQLAALAGTSGDDPALEGDVGGNLQVSSSVQAVVSYCIVSDILTWGDDLGDLGGGDVKPDSYKSAASALVGWDQPGQGIGDIKEHLDDPEAPYPELVALCRSVSPMEAIVPGRALPPFLIAHGDMDQLVPYQQSERLLSALEAAGAPCTYLLIPGAEHNRLGPEVDDLAASFLVRNLIGCEPDLNLDGRLDLFDFLSFFNSFLNADPVADCTQDGVLDLFDLLCFGNLFNAGC